jgi:hypothetical protein
MLAPEISAALGEVEGVRRQLHEWRSGERFAPSRQRPYIEAAASTCTGVQVEETGSGA